MHGVKKMLEIRERVEGYAVGNACSSFQGKASCAKAFFQPIDIDMPVIILLYEGSVACLPANFKARRAGCGFFTRRKSSCGQLAVFAIHRRRSNLQDFSHHERGPAFSLPGNP
jgi:hypothetical protein